MAKRSSKVKIFEEESHRVGVPCRDGVKDTKLEAKAKDTKKIRGLGQGQPFRG